MKTNPTHRLAFALACAMGFSTQSHAIPITPTTSTMNCFDEGAPNPGPTSDTQCVISGSVAGTVAGNEFSWWLKLADPTFLRIDANPSDSAFKVSARVGPLDSDQRTLFSASTFAVKLLGLNDAVLVDFSSNRAVDFDNYIDGTLSSSIALDIKSIQLSLTCNDQDLTGDPACPTALNLDGLIFEKKIGFKTDPNNPQGLPIFDRRYMSIQETRPPTIPEPSTLALLGLGALGLVKRRRNHSR
jgi:hypothetical protein